MLSNLLNLFVVFLKIGFSSYGGMSAITVINQEMTQHGWMTSAEVFDIVAIAEMTPGALGINCATFVGMRLAGIPGAIIATLGALSPSLTLLLIAARYFAAVKTSPLMTNALYGIRPAVLGLVASALVTMRENLFIGGQPSLVLAGIALAVGVLLIKFKWSIPRLIGISALLGILLT